MTKIDIFSGFLGAGKTTLIKKLIAEAYTGEKIVLIENEFGEIAIDGGFLKDSGVQINEMNSGCICCSLVGDFADALQKVLTQFHPDRILIEPSGVGKLSDVIRAVQGVQSDELVLNGFTTVVDANKCKMYMKNFGEFFNNQVENASAIILSRTEGIRPEKLDAAVALLREKNPTATIVTTPWTELNGKQILETMERRDTLSAELEHLKAEAAEDDDEDEHEHHHHHHDDDEHECCCGHHHHHDDDDDDDDHEHHEHSHEHGHEHGGANKGKKLMIRVATAVALLALALCLDPLQPINKKLWTPAFVFAAGAYSLGMFALFYYIIDVCQWRRWSYFFKVIGVNSITIYMVQRIVRVSYTSEFFFGGLASKLSPEAAAVVLSAGYVAVCWLLLWFLDRKKIYLKI